MRFPRDHLTCPRQSLPASEGGDQHSARGGPAIYAGGSFLRAFDSGDSFLARWGCPNPDMTPPGDVTNLTSTTHQANVWSPNLTVTMTWSAATDDLSGVDGYALLWDQDPAGVPPQVKVLEETATSHTEVLSASAAGWYFHIAAVDYAGNFDPTPVTFGPVLLDDVAPDQGTIQIEGGAATTFEPLVDLDSLGASETMSGLDTMRFSNDGTTWSPEEAYATTKTGWKLSGFGGRGNPGTNMVFVQYRDVAGNLSTAFSDTIDFTPRRRR